MSTLDPPNRDPPIRTLRAIADATGSEQGSEPEAAQEREPRTRASVEPTSLEVRADTGPLAARMRVELPRALQFDDDGAVAYRHETRMVTALELNTSSAEVIKHVSDNHVAIEQAKLAPGLYLARALPWLLGALLIFLLAVVLIATLSGQMSGQHYVATMLIAASLFGGGLASAVVAIRKAVAGKMPALPQPNATEPAP